MSPEEPMRESIPAEKMRVRQRLRNSRLLRIALAGSLMLWPAVWWVGRGLWAEQHLRQAQQALSHHDFAAARAHTDACLRLRPGRAEAHLLAARAARRAGAFADAEHHLQEYARRQNDPAVIALEGGLLDAQRGRWSPRLEAYLWARVEDDPPDRDVILEAMARGYLFSFRLGNAQRCLNLWLQRQPHNSDALYLRGLVWGGRRFYDRALEDYRRAVDNDAEHIEARKGLAEMLVLAGQTSEALAQFEQATRRAPDDAVSVLGQARCLHRLGRLDEAKQLLDRFLAQHTNDAAALGERAALARESEGTDEAEKWYRRAVATDPGDEENCYALAQCLLRTGQEEEGNRYLAHSEKIRADLKRFHQLVTEAGIRPEDADLRYELGMICLRNGRKQEGRRWLLGALQTNPRHQAARQALDEHFEP